MISKEILNSHPVTTLKKEVAKTNVKGYSKMKKAEVVELMLKHKEKFGHITMKGKAKPAEAEKPKKKKLTKEEVKEKVRTAKARNQKPAEKPKAKSPAKAKSPEKPKAKSPEKKGIDFDEVNDELAKKFIDNNYQDYIEMYLDGRGSEEKQLDRASGRVATVIMRILKRTAREMKFKTDKELIDYWIKNKSVFDDFVSDPKSKLPKEKAKTFQDFYSGKDSLNTYLNDVMDLVKASTNRKVGYNRVASAFKKLIKKNPNPTNDEVVEFYNKLFPDGQYMEANDE